MRLPGQILFIWFTLLLTVQGEPVLGARTKVIVRPAGDVVPENVYGLCVPVRLSCDGVPVCIYDARLPEGEWVASLSADELAVRGVRLLRDVLPWWRRRELRLFLELCPPDAPTLTPERQAERELILQRADSAACAAFAVVSDAACGCVQLAEKALQTAYDAGFRQGEVWLVADDAEVLARYGGRSSKVPVCYLSPDGTCAAGARGLFLHRSRIESKAGVKRLRRGGRRVAVWDVNSAEDAEAVRDCGVDFIVTDDAGWIDSER